MPHTLQEVNEAMGNLASEFQADLSLHKDEFSAVAVMTQL